jgi:hypothetical protein
MIMSPVKKRERMELRSQRILLLLKILNPLFSWLYGINPFLLLLYPVRKPRHLCRGCYK